MPSDAHFQRLSRLLSLESDAEARQVVERRRRFTADQAERSGYALVGLAVVDTHGGLGGRFLVTLAKRSRAPLPWTTLKTGSPVLLAAEGAKTTWRGVVAELSPSRVQVALETFPEDFDEDLACRLDLAGDETARQRQKAALDAARSARVTSREPRERRLAELRDVLLGESAPRFAPEVDIKAEHLDASQRGAVAHALAAQDVAVIHGPPGTGKTTAVVELIRQAAARGEKVLACAPSNLAVDNILERLVAAGVSAVRLGHPARVLPALQSRTLDLLVQEHEDFKLARKLVREAQKLFHQADRYTRAKPEPGAKQAWRSEARALLRDARRLEAQAADRLLDGAAVVCATTTALDPNILGDRRFELAVLDEAAQATEPLAWIPLLRAERLVLAGDHCQLPPTVVSREAAEAGFGRSLLESVVALYGDRVTRRLDVQYRMNEVIMGFPSREFYDGTLVAAPSVAHHVLPGLAPLLFLDTAGAGFDEETEPDGESRRNPREAEVVVREVRALLASGLPVSQLGVITPYAGQVRLLRSLLGAEVAAGLEVDSIDGFQGREKEAVVISCVRSNADGEIGFLAETRRMNVALTRARRRLVVVGDSATLGGHAFYQDLLAYVEGAAAYGSVWELGLV